jgi:GT2 family glycosyltransferase
MNDRVCLAYVHTTAVAYSWHRSMSELWKWDLSHEGRIYRRGGEIEIFGGTGGLTAARNRGVQQFLTPDPPLDWLFWVDTDMGFAPHTVDALLSAADPLKRPIMGALCFAQKLPEVDGLGGYQSLEVPTIYDWDTDAKTFRARFDYERDAVMQCAGTGSACILIHRSVFERMDAGSWYSAVPNLSDEIFGEDLSFCLRAAALDIPVHVNAAVKTSHLKQVWIDETHYRALREGATAVYA